MQISSLIDILDGELQNSPSISFIYDIKTKVSKFKEGDAIISNSQTEITKAILRGAFGVIFSSDTINVTDREIAWIKVKDLHLCIVKLARYHLANMRVKSYVCDKPTFELLQIWQKLSPKTLFLDDNIAKNFEKIKSLENGWTVFSYDIHFLSQILPTTKPYKSSSYKVKNVIEHSLFEVSFSYRNVFFNRFRLPVIYLKNFIEVADYYGIQNLQMQRLKKFKHFIPLFINKNSEILEFGKSDKFIITQNDKNVLLLELNYLQSRFAYGKKIFLLPKKLQNSVNFNDAIYYNTKKEISEYINNAHYNCLYIFGIGEDRVEAYLKPSFVTKSLF